MLHPPTPMTTDERIVEIYNAILGLQVTTAALGTQIASINVRCVAEDSRIRQVETAQTRTVALVAGLSAMGGWLFPTVVRMVLTGSI